MIRNFIKKVKKILLHDIRAQVISIISFGIIVSLVVFLIPLPASTIAISSIYNLPFGGTIKEVDYETCCAGFIIEVTASKTASPQGSGGSYYMSWLSYAFSMKYNYMPMTNAPVLGKATRGGFCLTIDGECYEDVENTDWEFYSSLGDQIGVATPLKK